MKKSNYPMLVHIHQLLNVDESDRFVLSDSFSLFQHKNLKNSFMGIEHDDISKLMLINSDKKLIYFCLIMGMVPLRYPPRKAGVTPPPNTF